jgi:hypothetical protein
MLTSMKWTKFQMMMNRISSTSQNRMRDVKIFAVFVVVAIAVGQGGGVPVVPIGDYHQHLFSPALVALVSSTPPLSQATVVTAKDLIAILDTAGIQRAAVLSTTYIFTQPTRNVENDREKVKTDNDWTASQVALFPDSSVFAALIR